ncbi:MAG TPA: SRPBCC family protein [Polyangiaceae bacterium]|jgi:uncharacterized protein YndB with AHSA1/START domain|nr:SRPBCC family protein [Polyangiaceae bacterium]
MTSTDKVEKQVVLRAPISKVWRALTDHVEFGRWFGFKLENPFVPGQTVRGRFEGTLDEGAIMAQQQKLGVVPSHIKAPKDDLVFCTVERIEPERYFSFRWIPYGIDAEIDPLTEPTTLVEFSLEAVPEGTRLSIVESGFDRITGPRRLRAYRMNDGGWTAQGQNLKTYVERA